MGSQYSKRYSEEFRRDAIALARSSDKTITEVARDLGVSPESLRGWVKRDRIDRGEGGPGELTSAEREELKRLRRQNAEQQKTIEILKKSGGLLRQGQRPVSEVYRFIAAEKAAYPVALLCRVLGVVRSSFYAWLEAEEVRQARTRADDALAHEITVIHLASKGAYGVPRVHAELRRLGRTINRKRVERVMRERGIAGVTRRRRRSLARPAKQARPAPDLLGRDFTAARPGTRLVGDITYLPTQEGWLYLACWLDLATREVVGYAMADHHRAGAVSSCPDQRFRRSEAVSSGGGGGLCRVWAGSDGEPSCSQLADVSTVSGSSVTRSGRSAAPYEELVRRRQS
ncbi:IS3 family transposase [Streptomyces rugosispiralis]|uniref:IS3 family transposase n=1 Tax=Streptomyces rugosispiralis TaxID=2967341 RepID=A0ABT1V9E6_9ACTN|nr:IS3 family transposase [Streptomyces rugosispiralis]MCQ8193911.1 IS3 family transposase [Streptomyces rugosispiralis]